MEKPHLPALSSARHPQHRHIFQAFIVTVIAVATFAIIGTALVMTYAGK